MFFQIIPSLAMGLSEKHVCYALFVRMAGNGIYLFSKFIRSFNNFEAAESLLVGKNLQEIVWKGSKVEGNTGDILGHEQTEIFIPLMKRIRAIFLGFCNLILCELRQFFGNISRKLNVYSIYSLDLGKKRNIVGFNSSQYQMT